MPTLPAFAAWKTVAWLERGASRDLFDLWLLADAGAINAEAATLFARYGPTNQPPDPRLFRRTPDEDTWRWDLAGQTHHAVTATAALTAVRDTWTGALE